MVGRHKHKAALGHLMDARFCQIVRGISGKFLCKFVCKTDIVRLERALVGRVGMGQHDHGEGVAGGREGGVVDASDLRTQRYGEARRRVMDREVVQHNRLQVALGVGRTVERDELLLLDCDAGSHGLCMS